MKKRAPDQGFTLIELVAVALILALFSNFVLPKVTSVLGITLRTASTKVAGYLQAAYEHALMRHETIRVVFDFEQKTYWTEKLDQQQLLTPLLTETSNLDEVIKQFETRAQDMSLFSNDEEKKTQTLYNKFETETLKTNKLPSGVRVKGIYLPNEDKILEQQNAWIYFSPSGFGSKAIIYLINDSDEVYSIILPPLGGRSRIQRGEIASDDA